MLLVVAIFAALALLVIYPLYQVFRAAVWVEEAGASGFTWRYLAELASKPYNRTALTNSLLLGFLSAATGTLVGFFFAFALTRTAVPFKPLFKSLAIMPIISPPFVIALSAILLFGRNGLFTRHLLLDLLGIDLYQAGFTVYGLPGLLGVQVLGFFPTAFLLLAGPLQAVDPHLEESALNLGASRWRTFRQVTLPLLYPALLSSFLLLFIESLADFGTPLILSGRFQVLSVQAYLEITGNDNQPGGSALALMLLIPSILLYFFNFYLVQRFATVTVTGKPAGAAFQYGGALVRRLLTCFCLLVSLLVVLLYGLVLVGSFTRLWGLDYSLTLQNYRDAFTTAKDYILDSLTIASLAAPLTGLLGQAIAFLVERKTFPGRRLMEAVAMLTFAVPGTVVGIGYLLAFNKPPLVLQGTATIIILLLIFRNAPVGIRAGITLLKQISPQMEEAAATLGAGSFTTFHRIVLPQVCPALFSGMAYSFARCMTSISAVIFVVSGNWNLMTIAILGFVENADFSHAAALSVILVAIVLGVLLLVERGLLLLFRSRRVELEPVVT